MSFSSRTPPPIASEILKKIDSASLKLVMPKFLAELIVGPSVLIHCDMPEGVSKVRLYGDGVKGQGVF